jgi:AcrR family transcriptional regulator
MSYPAEHRRLTKQKIVRSARRLFNRRGFDTVSIDDVMADAGLTRGSSYSYFESKGDLYAEAVTQILNEKQLLSSDGVSIDPRAVDSAAQFVRDQSKNLDLGCISPHQTSRRRSEGRYSPFRCEGHIQLGENRHGGCVRTRHLHGEGSLNFVLGRCGFDHRERGIHGEF